MRAACLFVGVDADDKAPIGASCRPPDPTQVPAHLSLSSANKACFARPFSDTLRLLGTEAEAARLLESIGKPVAGGQALGGDVLPG